eukprot:TRINITY_DN17223_c0_g2_i2.p1 TRINITY_DN17223_c0_g2~~TRINITY_DN17223_c0_g2_i2.p1  ORF type:complete len:298 (-),score=48.03 TRINITY_DN17223_c0_g2_i2:186-971(-)
MAYSTFFSDRDSSYADVGTMGTYGIFVSTKLKYRNVGGIQLRAKECKLLMVPNAFMYRTQYCSTRTREPSPYRNQAFNFSKSVGSKRSSLSSPNAKTRRKNEETKVLQAKNNLKVTNMEISLPYAQCEILRAVKTPNHLSCRRTSAKGGKTNGKNTPLNSSQSFGLTTKKLKLFNVERKSCSACKTSTKDDLAALKHTEDSTPNKQRAANSKSQLREVRRSYIREFLKKSRMLPHRIAVECNTMISIRKQSACRKAKGKCL